MELVDHLPNNLGCGGALDGSLEHCSIELLDGQARMSRTDTITTTGYLVDVGLTVGNQVRGCYHRPDHELRCESRCCLCFPRAVSR